MRRMGFEWRGRWRRTWIKWGGGKRAFELNVFTINDCDDVDGPVLHRLTSYNER